MRSVRKKDDDVIEHVTITQSFAGKVIKSVDNVNNLLVFQSQIYYQHKLNKFKGDEQVLITISNKKPKRTEQQNRYYWGVYLPLIALETGERNLERLHTLFKGKFLTESIVEVLGQKVRIVKSTTGLSKGGFGQYIMDIEAETGIQAPPTENYGLEPIGV